MSATFTRPPPITEPVWAGAEEGALVSTLEKPAQAATAAATPTTAVVQHQRTARHTAPVVTSELAGKPSSFSRMIPGALHGARAAY
jgi:hypothetical protein